MGKSLCLKLVLLVFETPHILVVHGMGFHLYLLRGRVTIPAHFSPGQLPLILGFEQKLQRLKNISVTCLVLWLLNLHYNHTIISIILNSIEDVGIVGAVNWQLEA